MTKLKLSRDVIEESNESMEEAKADRHSDPEFYPNTPSLPNIRLLPKPKRITNSVVCVLCACVLVCV